MLRRRARPAGRGNEPTRPAAARGAASANPRRSGILLHVTSLPGPSGIGDLGGAHHFVEFLAGAGQRIWQVLPLGPTGYGDSPYQCFSAFAGNPLLIDLDGLAADGLLSPRELAGRPTFPEDAVDYGAADAYKSPLLRRAYERFARSARPRDRDGFARFRRRNRAWLADFSLFMALKAAHGGQAWHSWAADIARREPKAVAHWRRRCAPEMRATEFAQYLFHRQWAELRRHAAERGVALMGDVPIFVAHDSADVWAHPDLFALDERGRPTVVAGVPPDYFSTTGQLWGNPLYRWEVLAASGYRWWIERLRSALGLYDLIRLDHFRGFEAYWEVAATETTAMHGRWVPGPGDALFEALRKALGPLPIVAENLGVITPQVEALRERFGFPGMAILQFAFGADPEAPGFRPYDYTRNLVVYTGTHDNDTTLGWWATDGADHTRAAAESRAERAHAWRYLDAEGREIHWAFIRCALASVADTAILPLQDVLGLGNEARMNRPGRAGGNWRWRCRAGALTAAVRDRLRELTVLYGRSAARRPGD